MAFRQNHLLHSLERQQKRTLAGRKGDIDCWLRSLGLTWQNQYTGHNNKPSQKF